MYMTSSGPSSIRGTGLLKRGVDWNEAHVLRGLLADSRRYQPLLFVDQLLQQHPECFEPERALYRHVHAGRRTQDPAAGPAPTEIGAHGSFWMQVRS